MLDETATIPRQETCEDTLKRFDYYIISQVQRLKCSYPLTIHEAVKDLELDELAQCVRIKFWQALEKREIRYPAAYIKLIVRNEFINMLRRQKPLISLPGDEECIQGELGIWQDQHAPDPAEEAEQREAANTRLKEVIRAVLALPPRQRRAMLCALRERVDDLAQLSEAFKAHKVDIEAMRWPTNQAEKQLLKASLIPAKKTIEKGLKRHSA